MKLLRFTVAFIVMLVIGCGRDPNGLYVREFPDVGAYLHQEACVACLEDKCATEWTACMDDDGCRKEYECRGRCTPEQGPPCHLACTEERTTSADVVQAWYNTGNSSSPLPTCAVSSCPIECAIGRDFRCVGRYVEPSVEGDTLTVATAGLEWALGDGAKPIPGLTISPCHEGDLKCTHAGTPLPAATGPVDLVLRRETALFRHKIVFQQAGPDVPSDELKRLPVMIQGHTLPWVGGMFAEQLLANRSVIGVYWGVLGLSDEYNKNGGWRRPSIHIGVKDCAGDAAADLVIETDADCSPVDRCDFIDDADCSPLDGCAFYWANDLLSPDPAATQRISVVSATLTPRDETRLTVRVIDPATGRLVSSHAILPINEVVQTWWLYPLSANQIDRQQ